MGPYTPRALSTLLTGDYRILITWVTTGQHAEVPVSITVSPDATRMKEPLNAECNKPLLYLTSYDLLEHGRVTADEFVLAPVRDDFVLMKHPFRVELVPESAFPPEVSATEVIESGWTLDHVELGVRWRPSSEGTVAEGKLLAWYTRPHGESRLTSALLGLAAIYPETSFHSPPKRASDVLEQQ